ncbi:DUF222 domain-containing protein [Flexivirga sp. ID2601S]|uniref:DUF222 domain-containing protein n=1 Tax=Flexivirga aerilata TaxID=1656889 RepID=A0A849ALK6_9MICO|nr:HNH endonuclease signature motif containing protein [Flexivirga aerilata]NNG40993.1 DUF222 domain-containing protein [Flexivirga aerilata]
MSGRRVSRQPVPRPGGSANNAALPTDSSYADSSYAGRPGAMAPDSIGLGPYGPDPNDSGPIDPGGMDHDGMEPVDLLAPGDETALPGGALQAARDELAEICGQINDGHSRLVELMRRVLADELWAGAGLKSPEHWLTAFAGLTWSSAHDIVRIAGRAGELPTMTRLLDDGKLTLGQAAVVAKYTPAAYDDDVSEFASYATVTQLRRSLARYEFNAEASTDADAQCVPSYLPGDPIEGSVAGPVDGPVGDRTDDPSDPDRQQDAVEAAERRLPSLFDPAIAQARLEMRYTAGRFILNYDAPADIGALVEQALLEAKDALFALRRSQTSGPTDGQDASADPPPPTKVTLGEAMTLLAERSLDHGAPVESTRARRYRVYLHLDTAGSAWLHKGAAIPPSLRDRMVCDGVVQPIWESEGRPISVGRAQRIVPEHTRHVLEDRDRGCRFPGCLALHNLECHHLDHWIDGGLTDADRLLMLCRFHHHEHHRGAFTMVGDASRRDGVLFVERGGAQIGPLGLTPPLDRQPPPPPSEGAAVTAQPVRASVASPPPRFEPYAGPTNDTLHLAWVRFDARRRPHTGSAESRAGHTGHTRHAGQPNSSGDQDDEPG